ncbi:YTH domain-containing protein ECT1-like isoform X2 [Tripterygium wilfordii]|uniref:YTH domain-containing protein ECT1-like isoform X2 n=1 Tax=Tripterygium wilfordii TaxID=458696 RepID=UPI0018F847C9|nr:YTH domain-containing protein ECT1-like isoform X2 [Tripterygium wilfordii]
MLKSWNISMLDRRDLSAEPNMLKDQAVVNIGPPTNNVTQSEYLSSVGDLNVNFSPTTYPVQSHPIYHGGYNDSTAQWGAFLPHSHTEGLKNSAHGIYNETSSLPFHGYASNSQMVQRPYSPIASQLPFVPGHGQFYNEHYYPASDLPHQQRLVPPNHPCNLPPTSISQSELCANIDVQGASERFVPRQGYLPVLGSSGRGNILPVNSGSFNLLQQGFDEFGVGGLRSERLKFLNEKSSLAQLSASAHSPKPIGSLGFPKNNFDMASQQKELLSGFGSHSSSSYNGNPQHQCGKGSSYGITSTHSLGMSNQNWPTLDEARLGERCSDFPCGCSISLDTLSERNRGPRAFKPRSQTATNGTMIDNFKNDTFADIYRECYKTFATDYKEAKFFVIKSYSEDNVHKSIKYGVWASTPNGNKKLDTAYHEAKEKETYPIFLLFSVNASAQFCGVAEMIGPVDFDKSVDYWQQDKWSGQFPVKWHIIKDVPNSQFRHIILENNDNKPVTNSRDTQEVGLRQGIQMLDIFKNYETCSSILDDFQFYEERQKAMRERKSKQQESIPVASHVAEISEQLSSTSLSDDFVKRMSRSFAQALLLSERETKNTDFQGVGRRNQS